MTDWIAADSPSPGPAWEGSAEASTPLAAALLLGISLPQQHADRVGRLMLHAAPVQQADEDGMLTYAWNGDGVWIALIATSDGTSRASCRIARVTHTVNGEVVRREVAG